MPRIFISYRRDDSRTITGRIYDRLVQAFGTESVFKDVQDIHSGQNWKSVLQQEIERSDIIIAVIGAQWLHLTDDAGNRRIMNDDDYVRLEVAHGLQDDSCTVIPLLVNGATVPPHEMLPTDLQPLTERQALRVREDPDFHADMTVLIRDIYRLTGSEPDRQDNQRVSTVPAPPARKGFQFSGAFSGCSFNLAVTLGVFVLVAGLGTLFIGEQAGSSDMNISSTQIAAVSSATAQAQRVDDAQPTFDNLTGESEDEPLITPEPCTLKPRLTIGDRAEIIQTSQTDGLSLYRMADTDSRVLFRLSGGTVVNVLDGPVCADGVYLWRIESDDRIGWAVEGDDQRYFLAPAD